MNRHLAPLMAHVFHYHSTVEILVNAISQHRLAAAALLCALTAGLLFAAAALCRLKPLASDHDSTLRLAELGEYAAYTRKMTSW